MLLAWDFDGVLVDTVNECCASYNAALKEYGLTPLTLDQFRVERKTAVQAADFFTQYLARQQENPYTPERLKAVFQENKAEIQALRQLYHKHRDVLLESQFPFNPTYPGIQDTLTKLKRQGTRMAVVSARDDASLNKYLAAKNLSDFFETVVGSSAFDATSDQLKKQQVTSLEEKTVWFIDDMPRVLYSLQGHARLFYAEWGYGLKPTFDEDVTTLKRPQDILSYVKTR